MKITKFSIDSPCQAIFFFRWLLLACVVPMSRLPRSVWNVFVFTFIPVWIHAGLKSVGSVQQAEWLETGLSYFRPGLSLLRRASLSIYKWSYNLHEVSWIKVVRAVWWEDWNEVGEALPDNATKYGFWTKPVVWPFFKLEIDGNVNEIEMNLHNLSIEVQ
jgi:hypothetical protein